MNVNYILKINPPGNNFGMANNIYIAISYTTKKLNKKNSSATVKSVFNNSTSYSTCVQLKHTSVLCVRNNKRSGAGLQKIIYCTFRKKI